MLDGHFPSQEMQVFHRSSRGMLGTKLYYTLIVLDLNSRVITHQLSGKLSPSRRDMQAISQLASRFLQKATYTPQYISIGHMGKREEQRVRQETSGDHVQSKSHLVGPHLSIRCHSMFPRFDPNSAVTYSRMTAALVRLIIIRVFLGIYA